MNIMGSYSGIDKNSIDGLMQIEKLPLVTLAKKKTDITDKQNAWKDVNTRLNSLFEKSKALQNKETYTAKTSTSSNDNIVSMTANKNAASGTYKINVSSLATGTSLVGGKIASVSIDAGLGVTGNLSIKNADFESNAYSINIESGDSLKTVVDKINNGSKDTGISATIIDNRIVLNDSKTGVREISLEGSAISQLGLNIETDGDETSKVIYGTRAKFTINGIEVERDSNTITDVVENITINLKSKHVDGQAQTETLTVSLDTSKTEKAIKEFVDQYNSTMLFIGDKIAAGDSESPGSRGILAGDSTLQRLYSNLRNMVTSPISNAENPTTIRDISQLGVSTVDRFGQLTFDATKLKAELSKDPENVQNFFAFKDSSQKEMGFSFKTAGYIDSIISKTNGVIKGKNESFEKGLKDIEKQIERFNIRIERKEAYYTKMFAALDVAMMQAESQMEWLNGQISAMNAQFKK